MSLFKKELRENVAFWTVALILFLGWFFDEDVGTALLAPVASLQWGDVLLVHVALGGVLGFGQLARERWNGTLPYLLHRGVGAGRILRTKIFAGCATGTGITASAMLLFVAYQRLFSPAGAIVQWGRVLEYLAIGTTLWSAYGIGALAAAQRGALPFRIVLAIAGLFGLGFGVVALFFADVGSSTAELVWFPLLQVALAAAFLVQVRWRLDCTDDEERVLPPREAIALGVSGPLLLALPLTVGTAFARGTLRHEIESSFDTLAYSNKTGEVRPLSAFRDHPGFGTGEVLAIGGGARRSYEDELADPAAIEPPRIPATLGARWAPLYPSFQGYHRLGVEVAGGVISHEAWLDVELGDVHTFAYPGGFVPAGYVDLELAARSGIAAPRHDVLAKPSQHEPFSPRTQLLTPPPLPGEMRSLAANVALFDPDDLTLWTIRTELEGPKLEQIHPPGGARVVGWEWCMERELAKRGWFWRNRLALLGEDEAWLWNGSKLRPLSDFADLCLASEARDRAEVLVRVSEPDLLTPRVEAVSGATGEVLFSHRQEPRGIAGRVCAAFHQAFALTRAPAVTVASFLAPARVELQEGDMLREPLFQNGSRPLLLLGHLLLTAVFAAAIVRNLRSREAGGARIAAWLVGLALVGPFLYPVFRMVEPRRLRAGERRAPAPELLIRTA